MVPSVNSIPSPIASLVSYENGDIYHVSEAFDKSSILFPSVVFVAYISVAEPAEVSIGFLEYIFIK